MNSIHSQSKLVSTLQENFPNFQRVLIEKNGQILWDFTNPEAKIGLRMEGVRFAMRALGNLFPGMARTSMNRDGVLWNVRSITKSILSLMIGLAFEQGKIKSLDFTLSQLLPDSVKNHHDKKAITLRQLITMTSGLPEMDTLDKMLPLVTSKNWLEHILSIPLSKQPGKKYIYSTGASHLAACILQKCTGISNEVFLSDCLFNSMGINQFFWEKDPQGIPFGGSNLFLIPEDLLKVGNLMLNYGVIGNKQLFESQWIKKSTSDAIETEALGYKYSYGWWWIGTPISKVDTLAACGFGGQRIYIRKENNLIAAVTSRPSFYQKTSTLDKVMLNEVIPYFESK